MKIINKINKYLMIDEGLTIHYTCEKCPSRYGFKCRILDRKINPKGEPPKDCPLRRRR